MEMEIDKSFGRDMPSSQRTLSQSQRGNHHSTRGCWGLEGGAYREDSETADECFWDGCRVENDTTVL